MNNLFYRGQSLFTTYITPLVYKAPTHILLNKNAYVETLRGIAIILVVIGHVIGYSSTGGMKVADDSIFRYIYFSLEYIRMPLFTVISGWVYANKPVRLGEERSFLKGKFRRLIIPMFAISTLLYVMRNVVPGTNSKPNLSMIGYNLIFPYDLFWFLYSLFVIFIMISLIDTRSWLRSFQGWIVAIGCAFILLMVVRFFMQSVPNVFSFKGAVYLLPFFLLGIGMNRFSERMFHPYVLRIVLFLFLGGIIVQQLAWFGYYPMQQKHSLLGLTIGVSAAILFFQWKVKNNFLIWVGSYAYSIFLFHVFFTGGTRIVLLKAGISNQWVILFMATVLSVLIPIVIENILGCSRVLRLVFLGRK
jgi:fucose 4-O-acetylase-like acetyltransferase